MALWVYFWGVSLHCKNKKINTTTVSNDFLSSPTPTMARRKATEAVAGIDALYKNLPDKGGSPKEIYIYITKVIELLETPGIDGSILRNNVDHICHLINTHADGLKKLEILDDVPDQESLYMFSSPIAHHACRISNLKIIKTLYENGFDLTFDSDYAFYTLINNDDKSDEKVAIAQFMIEKGCSLRKYMTNISEEIFEGVNDFEGSHAMRKKATSA